MIIWVVEGPIKGRTLINNSLNIAIEKLKSLKWYNL